MNILFLCDEYPPCRHGGIGSVTRILARELVKKGQKVIVCGFYPYYRTSLPFEIDLGVKVYRRFYGNRLRLKLSKHHIFGKFINIHSEFEDYLRYLRNLIIDHNIEIIEMPDYHDIFRYSGPKHIQFPDFGIPKIVKIHGGQSFFNFIRTKTIAKDMLYGKEARLLTDASLVLAISVYSKNIIQSIFNYKKDIPVIYNGIEIDRSAEYYPDIKKKIVVFAGTIAEKKGIFSLVKSWKRIISAVPDANLYIYGKGSNRTIGYLNKLTDAGTRRSIQMKGFSDKETLKATYSKAMCAVFPSYAESFGMAPIEAMAMGCPTIFTLRTSGPELIQDGIDGLLVDPDNIEEISDAVIFLLNNIERAHELGHNGAMKVRSHFNISMIAEQHLELYKNIIIKELPVQNE